MNESLGKLISCIYRYGRIFMEKQLIDYDINSSHLPFLLTIFRNEGLSQDELSDMLHIDKTTTARAVKILVEQDYVKRKNDENDKRIHRLFITKKGQELAPVLKDASSLWTKRLVSGFSPEEKRWAVTILDKMVQNAKKAKHGCCNHGGN